MGFVMRSMYGTAADVLLLSLPALAQQFRLDSPEIELAMMPSGQIGAESFERTVTARL